MALIYGWLHQHIFILSLGNILCNPFMGFPQWGPIFPFVVYTNGTSELLLHSQNTVTICFHLLYFINGGEWQTYVRQSIGVTDSEINEGNLILTKHLSRWIFCSGALICFSYRSKYNFLNKYFFSSGSTFTLSKPLFPDIIVTYHVSLIQLWRMCTCNTNVVDRKKPKSRSPLWWKK